MADNRAAAVAERLERISADAQTVRNLLAASTDVERALVDLADWCDGHPEGHGAFFEVQYGISADSPWQVTLFLPEAYRHPQANDKTVHSIRTEGGDLLTALTGMVEQLQHVTTKEV